MYKRIFLVGLLLTLNACVSTGEKPGAPAGADEETISAADLSMKNAVKLEKAGQHLEAAAMFNQLANTSKAPKRQQLRLRATQRLLDAGSIKQAKRIWQETEIDKAPSLLSQHRLLGAKIALMERDADTSLSLLETLEGKTDINQAEVVRTRIATFDLQGNIQSAVFERIKLEPLIRDEKEIETNQQAILQLMQILPENVLNRLAMTGDSRVTKGWAELALIQQKAQDPVRRTGQVNGWRSRYPDHPARASLLSSIAPQQQDGPPDLKQIALLLPFEGNYKKAADAFRDGFLTAFYHDESATEKPIIRFYDTSNPDHVIAAYQQALNEGATIIVGPLNKQAVETIAGHEPLSVPTLVLNQLADNAFYKKNLYQFGLSPEDEASQIAQRAWNEGHNNAAVIFPEGTWGERVSASFIQQWEALGGTVVTQNSYSPKNTDFGATLTNLLNIDKSEARRKSLVKAIGTKVKHEPRRRQDIDFIFMASFPKQARLIPPQLKFHHAGDLPIYTTSHSFSGKVNRRSDRDMDGVIIGDTPWTLFGKKANPLYGVVSTTWPESSTQFNRLYAMGVDAYNLLYYLNWLRSNPAAELTGATGKLHMDMNNRVLRELSWAQFVSGRPKAITTSPVLQNR